MKNGLIIDEEAASRHKLKHLLLKAYPGIALEECSDSFEACSAIEQSNYSIALVDIGFQNGVGKELITLIHESFPDTRIIVCTSFDDDEHLFSALHAGAYGYMLKDGAEDIFIDKLRGLINGDPPLSPGIARKLLRRYYDSDIERQTENSRVINEKHHNLSPRESEVLIYIAKGLSRKEIARLLEIADSTVAGYIKDIYRSLNISCRAEAAIHACRMGLINPDQFH